MAFPRFIFFLAVVIGLICKSRAEIRSMSVKSDTHPIIPIDEFGFTHTGRLELNVSQVSLSNNNIDLSKVGFFLCTHDSWLHVLEQLEESEVTCALDSRLVKKVITFDSLKSSDNLDSLYTETDSNQYTLVFANCYQDLKVTMSVHSAMYNLDGKSRRRDYLSAGKTILPRVYFMFCLVYLSLAVYWVILLFRDKRTDSFIGFLMLAVVLLKAVNLLCEAVDKSYIKKTGKAHGWDVLFCIFSFLKGISLFTLILLIAAAISCLKTCLQHWEKKFFTIVIPLQVVANLAQADIGETSPFAPLWISWNQLFFLVDVVCCCAVLFPLLWSIKNLRSARFFGFSSKELKMRTLFRNCYMVVICYIYFTRVVVYSLKTIASYRFLWTSVVAAELATLALYAFPASSLSRSFLLRGV